MGVVRGFLYACSHGKLEIYLLVQANTNKVPKVADVLEPSVPRQLISGNGSREIQLNNLNALYFCVLEEKIKSKNHASMHNSLQVRDITTRMVYEYGEADFMLTKIPIVFRDNFWIALSSMMPISLLNSILT